MVSIGRDVKLPSAMRGQLDAAVSSESGRDLVFRSLDRAASMGLQGVLFRTLYEMSPTLDPGLLREVRARADELGLYLEVGVGKVNPYMTPELPEIRMLGQGSYLAGMQRMIAAAREIDCAELWTATAFQKPEYSGLFSIDRFRTDVEWSEQLRATEHFLQSLAPTLRDLGCHLNLETHEEITTFELVRLIDVVGADVLGITFDSANVVAQGESPLLAAERIAPHVRQTHLRDVALFVDRQGLTRYLAPCGAGVIDWSTLLDVLLAANPGLNLTIEGTGSHRGRLQVPVYEPRWHTSHGDLTGFELFDVIRLTNEYHARMLAGELPNRQWFEAEAAGDIDDFVRESAEFLRAVQWRTVAHDSIGDPRSAKRAPVERGID